jgi:thymidine phosphorylase
VQHGAGIDLHAKPGDAVKAGQPLFTMSTDDPERFERALEALGGSYELAPLGTPFTARQSLVAARIG